MTANDLPEEQAKPTHKDSGERCTSYHRDHEACRRCVYCGDWLRPSEMKDECRGYDPMKGAMA